LCGCSAALDARSFSSGSCSDSGCWKHVEMKLVNDYDDDDDDEDDDDEDDDDAGDVVFECRFG